MSSPKPLRIALGILALGLLTAAPTLAAPAPVELVGTLELLHGEDFDSGQPFYSYSLQTRDGRVPVKFRKAAPEGFVNGAVVQVRGQRQGEAFVAADGTTGSQVLATAPGWTGQRKLAVILMNFSNNASKPFTRAYANGVVFTNANSVRAYYAEQSYGAMVLQGTTFDWVRIPLSNSTCQYREWGAAAKAALASRGVDLSSFTNFMYMMPYSSACAWGGIANLPGQSAWINGTPSLRIPAHELAHNLGVHHASSLRCTRDGVRVALSSSCSSAEYGDPFTTMGAAPTRHGTNLSLVQLGYMPASATRMVTGSGSYALTHASATTGTRILAIPRGNGTFFYLEYRRPYGRYFDNFSSTSPEVNGVTIRIARGWSTITQSQLVDTVPSTTTFADAPLRLNRSLSDFLSRAKITVTALGTSVARVYIALPADTASPTAPGSFAASASSQTSISLAWSPSTDNRLVTGYRIWQDSTLIATAAATATSLPVQGLTPGTPYSFTIRAFDGAGNQSAAVTASATTRQPDQAPTAPGNLSATPSSASVRLSWTAAGDDHGISGYRVSVDGTQVGSTSGLVFTVTGLRPETTYNLSVRAVDTVGQIGATATITVTTMMIDLTAPSAPVAGIESTKPQWATLTWQPSTDNVGVTSYDVLRDGHWYATVSASVLTIRVPVGSSYTVVAVDAAGNESAPSNQVSA